MVIAFEIISWLQSYRRQQTVGYVYTAFKKQSWECPATQFVIISPVAALWNTSVSHLHISKSSANIPAAWSSAKFVLLGLQVLKEMVDVF